MPIVFGVIGVLLIVAGVRGTLTAPANPNLIGLLKDDLTGQPNYLEWMTAIFIIGAIGYIPQLRTLSRAFMAIVVIGLLFANRGFFVAFSQQTANYGPDVVSQGVTDIANNIAAQNAPSTNVIEPLPGLVPQTQPSTPALTIPGALGNIFGPGIG